MSFPDFCLNRSVPVYLGIGSNMGDKMANCNLAIDMIDSMPGSVVTLRSSFYRTEPVGVEGHDWYINCAACILTNTDPLALLKNLLEIEAAMGRKRKKKWDPRSIDIDILLFGPGRIITVPDLKVPHPLMHKRRFVLVPMAQIAPDLVHPVYNRTMTELLNMLGEDGQAVSPVSDSGYS